MTQQSGFWNTNAVGDGPSGGYSAQRFYDAMRRALMKANPVDGTWGGVIDGLVVSTPANAQVQATAGNANVYGLHYESTATETLAVSTPAATCGGRLVLEASWAAQTIRLKVVLSASGVTAIPALVQTPGTTYQISLATFQVTNTGAVQSINQTNFVGRHPFIGAGMTDLGSVVEPVSAANIIDPATITSGLIGAGIPLIRRVGNDPVQWQGPGNTLYDVSGLRQAMIAGTAGTGIIAAGAYVSVSIDISSIGFTQRPIAVVSLAYQLDADEFLRVFAYTPNTTTMYIQFHNYGTTQLPNQNAGWFAIGPVA